MDQLDRILLNEEQIAPRPGFAGQVMTSVQRELHPRPLRFPWALVCTAVLAAVGLSLLAGITAEALSQVEWLTDLVRLGASGTQGDSMLWAVGVLLGSGLAALGAYQLIDD